MKITPDPIPPAERREDRLTTFIYLLLRDHLIFGSVEEIMKSLGESDGFLLEEETVTDYCRSIADKLR